MTITTLSRLLVAGALAIGAGVAEAQGVGPAGLLPFQDPFRPLGTPVDCAEVSADEREKFAHCAGATEGGTEAATPAAAVAVPATGARAAVSPAGLLPFADPFATTASPPACAEVARDEREKLGYAPDCEGGAERVASVPLGGGSEAAPPAGGERPLRREDLPDLSQRVLSLPGARLASAPGEAGTGGEVAAFTVFYVYERRDVDGAEWLRVGRNAFGAIDGWLPAETAEDWRSMLVMQYAPKGERGRVLFFRRRDDLADFVTDRYVTEEVKYAYETIEAGEVDGDYFIAIEPALGVADDSVYLMPILDHATEFSALGERLRLLEVASLNTDAEAAVQSDVREVDNRAAPRRSGAYRRFKLGVAFLIDTTRSMGPYIDHTRAIVGSTLDALQETGDLDAFSVGLIGFRDSTEADARIGYTTKVYQPLDERATPAEIYRNFQLMQPTTASTPGFSEDAYAGLYTALNEMDWSPYDLRLVVLVTDAAPRSEFDPLARYPNYGSLAVVEDAARQNIALSVVHLLTPSGLSNGNVNEALPVYREISQTGDSGFSKYLPVDTSDPSAFRRQVERFQAGLVEAVTTLKSGRAVERTETSGEAADLGEVLVNEVFRAQLEYLGNERGQDAPRFYRAWAADRDLANPQLEAMSVKVFLTRNQLSALDRGVESILDAYLRQDTSGGDFFDAMQAIAAETSVEGGRRGSVERAGELLPSFLQALPYRSDFLTLDRRQWNALGASGQRQNIDTLRAKLAAYTERAEARDGWIDLGAGDRGLDVYPISLDLLP